MARYKSEILGKNVYDFFVKLIKKSQIWLKNSKKCNLQKWPLEVKQSPQSRVMSVLCLGKISDWKSHWTDGFLKDLNIWELCFNFLVSAFGVSFNFQAPTWREGFVCGFRVTGEYSLSQWLSHIFRPMSEPNLNTYVVRVAAMANLVLYLLKTLASTMTL